MKLIWLCLMVCVALLTGCMPIESLNPIYTDNNIIFDKDLLGRWGIPAEGAVLRLERGGTNSYVMIYEKTENSGETKVVVFDVHLVSLGGEKYFDIVSQTVVQGESRTLQMDSSKKSSRFAPAMQRLADGLYIEVLGPIPGKGPLQDLRVKLRPSHLFAKVDIREKSLSLSFLDDEWIAKAIKKRYVQASRMSASAEDGSKSWVLSSATPELQQLIVRASDEPGAFAQMISVQKLD
jgi:hypothetical protein